MFKTLPIEGGLARTLLVLATLVTISHTRSYGEVRLVGDNPNVGRIEIYYSGRWGTICQNNWGNEEVEVICRSLGYGSGKRIAVVPGTATIWLDNVDCNGNESSIVQCRHNGFGTHNCEHSQDVAVSCDVNSGVTRFCDFEMDMCGFYAESKNTCQWLRHSGNTQSSYTGPSHDHTTGSASGKYVYTEMTGGSTGQRTYLKSNFNISVNSGSLYFWYHMYGAEMGTLNVYLREKSTNNLIWSRSGNQGNEWKFTCRTIISPIRAAQVIFEGIRGSGYSGDMAIDDLGVSTDFCPDQGISCGFNGNYCGYETIEEKGINTRWFMEYKSIPLADHSSQYRGQYMVLKSSGNEGERAHLKSPPIQGSKFKMRIDFYYYLYKEATGGLQVRFEKEGSENSNLSMRKIWQDFGDHGKRWNYGCMDLPFGESGSVMFTGISGTEKGRYIVLDDVNITKGSCNVGVKHMMCTFDNPLMCNYRINCTSSREYTWRRHYGSTSTLGTGPLMDASTILNGYYLYAESSYGNPGDAVSITFPVSQVKGRYVKFSYHMYGNTVGDLIVHFRTNGVGNEVWKLSGDQENVWRRECLEIDFNIDVISFIAVRGSSFTGDIAIDNVFVDSKPCPNPVNCYFQLGLCNYSVVFTNTHFQWKGIFNYNHSGGANRIAAVSSRYDTVEGETTTLITKGIQPAENSSLQFNYMMFGRNVGKFSVSLQIYQVNPAFTQDQRNSSVEVWSTSDNRTNDWILGCVDLPTDEYVTVHFKVTGGDGRDGNVYLDNIIYNPEKQCRFGIVENVCNFDEPNICGYKVRCSDADRYTWIRGQNTQTNSTGPIEDHTGAGKRYFMYAEASIGRPGAMTHLDFTHINPPSGHYLEFYYIMNGADIGSFQVSLETSGKNEIKWQDHGNSGLNWIKGCVDMDGHDNVTIVFTATRGNGPYGDIAIDDIAFKAGVCKGHSIHCEFDDDIMCGYRNITDKPKWIRTKPKDNSIGGYQMMPETQYLPSIMASPVDNITDSCIRVHYKMVGRVCNLKVYTSSGKSQMFNVSGDNVTDYKIGQIYIRQAVTRIIFEAITNSYWVGACNTLIDRVEVTNGTCPQLVCPTRMAMACNDSKYCVVEGQLCNRINDCQDGSDEQNCPDSIDCDFKTSFYCGYQMGQGWKRFKISDFPAYKFKLNNSEYIMVLTNNNGSLTSPVKSVIESCVQFYYFGTNAQELQLEVLVHLFPSKQDSIVWRDVYASNNGWTLGQFSLSAGKVYLEFRGKATDGNLVIDNVVLLNGSCPTIMCSNSSFACLSNEKCISNERLCNRINDCKDGSDEINCTKIIACDFEDAYLCGYADSTWMLTNGRRNLIPPRDHSEGTYLGKYMVSNSSMGRINILVSPMETFSSVTCVSFYYSFHGDGYFNVHDNNNLALNIYPFNIKTWRKTQFQIQSGDHRMTFTHRTSTNNSIVALDSISTTPGNCPPLDCGENWVLCKNKDICIPHFKECDGVTDCPGNTDEADCRSYCGENWVLCKNKDICIPHFKECDGVTDCPGNTDEADCRSFNSTIRLIEGENAAQGFVEIKRDGTWYKLCKRYRWKDSADLVCRHLGYNGITRDTFFGKNPYRTEDLLIVNCLNNAKAFESCRFSMCYNCNCQYAGVDCSNTICPSTHVLCPPSSKTQLNTTNVCIPRHNLCDGEYNCPDGTDEENCGNCTINQFKCRSMECISNSLRCNGIKDCEDGSDEYHCFKYSETSKLMEVFFNGNYAPLCKDNLLEREIGDMLCKTIGRSHGIIGTKNTKGNGVFSIPRNQNTRQLLPGFDLKSPKSCEILNLTCARGECGRRSKNLFDFMIQFGSNAIPGEWPWQIALFYKGKFLCGGTLIDNYNVITAAHCVKNGFASDYTVFAGSIQRFFGGKTYIVSKIHAHPSFASYLLRNDVAVVQLQQPVEMSDYIQPACLPEKPWTLDMECFTTGWGKNEEGVNLEILQETRVHLLSRSDCKSYYEKSNDVVVCANNQEPYQPGCYGDSGGPLVCRNDHGFWELFGISSYGEAVCTSDISNPHAYADVYNLKSWILAHIR